MEVQGTSFESDMGSVMASSELGLMVDPGIMLCTVNIPFTTLQSFCVGRAA